MLDLIYAMLHYAVYAYIFSPFIIELKCPIVRHFVTYLKVAAGAVLVYPSCERSNLNTNCTSKSWEMIEVSNCSG